MRVLVVTASAPWSTPDGSNLVLERHVRHLTADHELTVLAAGADAPEPPVPSDRIPRGIRARWFGTGIPPAVDHLIRKARSAFSGEPAHVHWVERPRLVEAFRAEIAAGGYALVHLHGWGTAALARLAPAVPSIHVPVDAWSLGLENRLLARWRRPLERLEGPKVEAHERRHYPRCRVVVVVADLDARYLRERIPGLRVEVVANGVDAGPEPTPPPPEPVLGFHGAFRTAANLEAARVLAREVFPIVRRTRPDAELLLIGRDPPGELRRLKGDGIVVTRAVEDIRPWLERISVYVAPMVSGSGIKNKVLEAMAAGRPVVATPLGIEGIGAGAGIVVGGSPVDLAERAVELLRSETTRRELGRRGRERIVAEFTWQRSAAAIDRLWRQFGS